MLLLVEAQLLLAGKVRKSKMKVGIKVGRRFRLLWVMTHSGCRRCPGIPGDAESCASCIYGDDNMAVVWVLNVDHRGPGSGASGQERYLPREAVSSGKWPGVPFMSFRESRGTEINQTGDPEEKGGTTLSKRCPLSFPFTYFFLPQLYMKTCHIFHWSFWEFLSWKLVK